jgi:hypothetical protein
MLSVLAAMSPAASRRITQAGDLLGMLGAVFLVLGTFPFLKKVGLLAGGLCLLAAFLLIGIGIHWGVSPYVPKK